MLVLWESRDLDIGKQSKKQPNNILCMCVLHCLAIGSGTSWAKSPGWPKLMSIGWAQIQDNSPGIAFVKFWDDRYEPLHPLVSFYKTKKIEENRHPL